MKHDDPLAAEQNFWRIIEHTRNIAGQDVETPYFCQVASEFLSGNNHQAIYSFEITLRSLLRRANTFDIMAAMKICEGYVSDDIYLYFRAGLVSFGKNVFYGAIHTPELYAEQLVKNVDGEDVLYISDNAFHLAFGDDAEEDLPRDKANEYWDYNLMLETPSGEDWHEDDLPKRFPLLWSLVCSKNGKTHPPSL